MSLAKSYVLQHGQDPPGDFARYIKQAENDQMGLVQKILEMSKDAHEERRVYNTDIHIRDLEIESLRRELDSKEHWKPVESVENRAAANDITPHLESSVARGRESGKQKAKTMPYSPSDILNQIRQMTVEMILARAKVARICKEWNNMGALAATAIAESSSLKSEYLLGRAYLKRGVALYHLRLNWEAILAFKSSKKFAKNPVELYEVDRWLEKAEKAQIIAQSTTSTPTSPFIFGPSTSRTGSSPVPVVPNALKSELSFDSNFDSIRGFGSRTPSVASFAGTNYEAPQERQPRSSERGPEVRGPRPRERSPARSASTEQLMPSPMHRTPVTPRESSPLVPRGVSLNQEPTTESDKPRPPPMRAASTGTRPPENQHTGGLGRTASYHERSERTLDPLARLRAPVGNRLRASTQLRNTLLVRNAETAQIRRDSELGYFDIALGPQKARSPSGLAEIREAEQKLVDGIEGKAADRKTHYHKTITESPKIADLRTELDSVPGDASSVNNTNDKVPEELSIPSGFVQAGSSTESYREPFYRYKGEDIPSSEPAAETSPDDEFPFRRGNDRRKTYAMLPVVDYDHTNEETAQKRKEMKNEENDREKPRDRSGIEVELDRNVDYLETIEREGSGEPQEAATMEGEGALQSPTKDVEGSTGSENATTVEPPLEEGGPDDLYGVEEGYIPPRSRPASGISTPVTKSDEGSKDEDIEWGGIFPKSDALPQLLEPPNISRGTADDEQGSDRSKQQLQESAIRDMFVSKEASDPDKAKEEPDQQRKFGQSPTHDGEGSSKRERSRRERGKGGKN